MYILGITGGLGSGKSTAANYFLQKGAFIFDADNEAKKYLKSNLLIQKRLIKIFGDKIIRNESLDLLKLSKNVFSDKNHHRILNEIIWPDIHTILQSSIAKAINENYKLFIVDAALIFEAGYIDFYNSILLITADKKIRIKRVQDRNNIPFDQIEKRMNLQMSEFNKQKYAQTTIKNNGTISELNKKLERFWVEMPYNQQIV